MATTTNYGWTTPDDTDLVKNGASAIRSLGTSVDTALWSAGYSAGKNKIINGDFGIWQRGTSFSLAASTGITSGFSADRWQTATGTNQACTLSRQLTNDTTNLPNIQYCLRYQRNSGQTGTVRFHLQVNKLLYLSMLVKVLIIQQRPADYPLLYIQVLEQIKT